MDPFLQRLSESDDITDLGYLMFRELKRLKARIAELEGVVYAGRIPNQLERVELPSMNPAPIPTFEELQQASRRASAFMATKNPPLPKEEADKINATLSHHC